MTDEIIEIVNNKPKSNFIPSFFFLPAEKRRAMEIVYNFCRFTDDITDSNKIEIDKKIQLLKKWRVEFEKSLNHRSEYVILNRLGQVINRFNIPLEPFLDLIKGMEMDLSKKQYLSFNDLLEYCYNVASTVGLMTIEIFGYKHKNTKDYAINLGIALQLTNILRDIKEDAKNGRIYLPEDDLNNFNYTANDILRNEYNSNFINLMKYEYERANAYFKKADENLEECDRKSLFAARIMQHIYYDILQKIKRKKYDVFNHNIKSSMVKKVYYTTGVWVKYSLIY